MTGSFRRAKKTVANNVYIDLLIRNSHGPSMYNLSTYRVPANIWWLRQITINADKKFQIYLSKQNKNLLLSFYSLLSLVLSVVLPIVSILYLRLSVSVTFVYSLNFCPALYPCLSLSFSACLYLSVSPYLWLSLSVSLYVCLSLSASVCLRLSVCLFLSSYLSLFLCHCLLVSLVSFLYLCLCLFFTSVSVSFCTSVSVSFCTSVSVSFCTSVSVSVSVSVCLCLSLSVSQSFVWYMINYIPKSTSKGLSLRTRILGYMMLSDDRPISWLSYVALQTEMVTLQMKLFQSLRFLLH